MARNQWGPANPNWKGGLYSDWDDGWLGRRLALRAKLVEVLNANLEHNPPTPEELHWARRVTQEWPEWARDILLQHGFKRPT